ncbi:MAG TPA: methyltransferase, FxLD system [Ktedonobacteraceae bacterium]|nr:methyltransferase, FxLD system [Ktedonobacteraceae bacterium]
MLPENREVGALHQGLVDQLKSNGYLSSASVEAAFRAVPRHLFLPDVALEEVYRDQAIVTKSLHGQFVSSSSQPAIMAIMLEQLQLQPGQRVLEIGAGTGYNAALMAHIVGEAGQVVTIDIDEDIVEGARTHLAAAGFERVHVVCTDGGLGYPEAAPYDRVILTVNAADITPSWRAQLKPDGRLLLPLLLRGPQASIAFAPVGDHMESLSVNACGFMGLRGAFAEMDTVLQLHPEPGALTLRLGTTRILDARTLYELLQSPAQDFPLPIQVSPRVLFSGLSFWLALRDPLFGTLSASGPLAQQRVIPELFTFSGKLYSISTGGLFSNDAISVLTRASSPLEPGSPPDAFGLAVRSFGPAARLTERLIDAVMAWDAAGRPGERQLHVSAYPHDQHHPLGEADVVISKRWTDFVCNWT